MPSPSPPSSSSSSSLSSSSFVVVVVVVDAAEVVRAGARGGDSPFFSSANRTRRPPPPPPSSSLPTPPPPPPPPRTPPRTRPPPPPPYTSSISRRSCTKSRPCSAAVTSPPRVSKCPGSFPSCTAHTCRPLSRAYSSSVRASVSFQLRCAEPASLMRRAFKSHASRMLASAANSNSSSHTSSPILMRCDVRAPTPRSSAALPPIRSVIGASAAAPRRRASARKFVSERFKRAPW
mmetsp:Transcript_16198/g.56566  ORF Transcript_16198/g.56566 Transcript_16198/m.56566 type:complete len:234 (-) Transcript_16198:13-714(-)